MSYGAVWSVTVNDFSVFMIDASKTQKVVFFLSTFCLDNTFLSHSVITVYVSIRKVCFFAPCRSESDHSILIFAICPHLVNHDTCISWNWKSHNSFISCTFPELLYWNRGHPVSCISNRTSKYWQYNVMDKKFWHISALLCPSKDCSVMHFCLQAGLTSFFKIKGDFQTNDCGNLAAFLSLSCLHNRIHP